MVAVREVGVVSDFLEKANLTPELYRRFSEEAERDFVGFWDRFAREEISWFRMYESVLDDSDPPFYRFFVGGKLNMAYNCIDRHLRGWRKNKAAIIWESETGESRILTYRELSFQVGKFANVLKTLGVRRGDAVVMYMPMIPELAIAMLACARIGAIHSVVFAGLSSKALAERVNDLKPTVLITADGGIRAGKTTSLKGNVDAALREASGVRYVVVVEHTRSEIPMKTLRDFWWHDLMSDPDYSHPSCEAAEMDSEDPLFVLYTSGSTGKPKGVVHTTAGYLLWRILTTKWIFDLKDEDTFWSTADIGWISGHSYTLYGPLSIGATTFIYEGVPTYPDPSQWWYLVEKYNINVMYTAPTAIRALMRFGEAPTRKHDISSLRLLTTGGEKLNPAAWMWYYEHVGGGRCPVIDAYGQTETAGHMISSLPIVPQRPGSVGIPVPGIFPMVVDDEGNPILEPNRRGHLVFEKPWPSMIRTIWGNDSLYREIYWDKFGGRYYYTGDLAYVDKDGYFWMEGREDDVINVSAHRISCVEIETALTSHINVAEAAVVGRFNEVTGEEIIAFVVLKEKAEYLTRDELVRELREHVAQQIGPIARPSGIYFVKALPKTRSGKLLRRILKDIANRRSIEQDLSTIEDMKVIDMVKEAVEQQDQ